VKRYALLSLAAVIGAIACQEVATSPEAGTDLTVRYRVSNPPPPPIDTGASLSFDASPTFALQSRSISPTATGDCDGLVPGTGVIIPVTYLFDPTTNTGYLHPKSSPVDSQSTSANGMIRMRSDKNGVQHFDGKGSVTIIIDGCPLVVNLASVTDAGSSFGECTPPVIGDIAPQATPPRPGGCFVLHFDEVLLDGEDIGGANMNASPECSELGPEPPSSCDPFLESPEVIG
jgi:hypothetical protein